MDIVPGTNEEEDAEEVRELYEEVDLDVVSGSNAAVLQGLDAEEDEEEICQLYEEVDSDVLQEMRRLHEAVDSDVVPGSDGECQGHCLEEIPDSSSGRDSEMCHSSSDSESTSGYWHFMQALRAFRFECALAAFEPEFAGMRMIRNKREQHKKHDATSILPLHWLLNSYCHTAKQAVRMKLIDTVPRSHVQFELLCYFTCTSCCLVEVDRCSIRHLG